MCDIDWNRAIQEQLITVVKLRSYESIRLQCITLNAFDNTKLVHFYIQEHILITVIYQKVHTISVNGPSDYTG